MSNVSVEHIEIDEKGSARIAGTRSRVVNIVMDTRNGLTPEQICESYPHLSMAQIHAALTYYYDHQAELDAAIEREIREVDVLQAQAENQPTRDELEARLKRKSTR